MVEHLPPWSGSSSPMAGNDRGADWILDRDVECASPEDRYSMAATAWRTQREYVASSSEFYRHKLGAQGNLAEIELKDLHRLDLTTKCELQDAQDDAPRFGTQLAAPAEAIAREYETSGTGGRPTSIALSAADVETWMTIGARSYHTAGVRRHNIVLSTFGAKPYVVGFTHEVVEALGAGLTAPGLRNIDSAASALAGGGIDTLLSTPSTAIHLLDRLRVAGRDPSGLGLIHLILGGEPGASIGPTRSMLEAAFGAAVTEAMGLGDIAPSLFAECPAQQGMHFSGQGLVWPELVDKNGDPVTIEEGAEGEIVYTHLRREAMPLVRFRSRDHARIVSTECPCGRTAFTLRVDGRTDDMFIVRGVNVYPSAVQAVVTEVAPEATGRVTLLRRVAVDVADGEPPGPPVRVQVELAAGAQADDPLADRIARALHERLHFRASVDLLPTEQFASAHYKTKAVIDE